MLGGSSGQERNLHCPGPGQHSARLAGSVPSLLIDRAYQLSQEAEVR